jgi:hypothetical protein
MNTHSNSTFHFISFHFISFHFISFHTILFFPPVLVRVMEQAGTVIPAHLIEINLERLLSRLEEAPPHNDASPIIGSGISPDQRETLNQLVCFKKKNIN